MGNEKEANAEKPKPDYYYGNCYNLPKWDIEGTLKMFHKGIGYDAPYIVPDKEMLINKRNEEARQNKMLLDIEKEMYNELYEKNWVDFTDELKFKETTVVFAEGLPQGELAEKLMHKNRKRNLKTARHRRRKAQERIQAGLNHHYKPVDILENSEIISEDNQELLKKRCVDDINIDLDIYKEKDNLGDKNTDNDNKLSTEYLLKQQ